MTDSFSTPYPTPLRLDSLEERLSYVERLTIDRIKQLELLVSANAHKQEDGHTTIAMLNSANESLAAYIQRVETDLGERITAKFMAVDRARVRGDDGMHDLITRTANAIYAEVKKLEQRISDCELAVSTDKLPDDPEPPVDTLWHPYYAALNGTDGAHPTGNKRVAVLLRDGEINRPARADTWDWSECTHRTIVAWRYAKEGE